MTLSSTVNRASYSGNGSTTAFAFSYLFYSNTDLTVILVVDSTGVETVKTITTHYSVTGAGVASGGTVTMSTAPASGETLVIIRQVPLTQGLDLVENDPFPSELVEQQFDNLTMAAQQINTEVTRSIKLSEGDTTDVDLTLPTPVALKTFRWNAGLTALEEAEDPGTAATAAAASAVTASTKADEASASAATAVAYAVKVDGAASGSDHSSKAWAIGGTGITDTTSKGAAKEWASNPEDDTVAGAGTFSALHYSAKASSFATAASGSASAASSSAATASAAAAGIFWKEPVVNRSTANLSLTGEQTIDGILTSTSRILVMNQSAAAENGIYVTASGAWARAAPLDTWDEHVGATVVVSQGSAYQDTSWMCTVDPGGTLGSTAIAWASLGVAAVNFSTDNFETSTDYTAGTTTTLVITTNAGSEQNIQVFFDGVHQHKSTYTYTAGTRTITFDAAIPVGTEEVEVTYGSTLGVGTPADGTVGTTQLAATSVTTAKIADDAVTLAKIAPAVDGSIISFDASQNPVLVAPGNDGQVLTSAGAGAQPAFEDAASSGCWTLITETTASSSAAVDFTLDNSTYQMFMVIVTECRPATEGGGETLLMRYSVDGGSSFKSGSGHYDYHNVKIIEAGGPTGSFGGGSETTLQPYSASGSGQGNAAHELLNGQFFLNQTGDSASFSNITCSWCNFRDSSGAQHASWGQGYRTSAEVNNSVRFFYSASSAIAEGNFKIYGQVK